MDRFLSNKKRVHRPELRHSYPFHIIYFNLSIYPTTFFHKIRTFLQSDLLTRSVLAHKEFIRAKEILRRMLLENILPFWYPRVIDSEYGGHCLNHEVQGVWKGTTREVLVTQSRTLWFFSRIYRSKYGEWTLPRFRS